MPGTTNRGAVIIAIGYLVLIVALVFFCARQTSTFDEFSQYWGLFATIVGVVTGAIPAYFFKVQADRSEQRAVAADARADRESQKVQLFAAAAEAAATTDLVANRELFPATADQV